jgi:hypothetical protein
MENQPEQFDRVQQLLKLKRHEVPPPGYFDKFSRSVVAGIRAQQNREAYIDPIQKLHAEAPWLTRLWQWLEAKPAFAGAFGAAICAVIIGGIVLAEKPAATPAEFAVSPGSPFTASVTGDQFGGAAQPVMLTASNSLSEPPKNLFEMVQPGQTVPVGFSPAGN